MDMNHLVTIDQHMFGSTHIEGNVHIYFDRYSMPCFKDLCLVSEKFQNTNLVTGWIRCENYDNYVQEYLETQC